MVEARPAQKDECVPLSLEPISCLASTRQVALERDHASRGRHAKDPAVGPPAGRLERGDRLARQQLCGSTKVLDHLATSAGTLREAIAGGDTKPLMAVYSSTASILDKSVQKGVLHKNTASRYKSRLNARVKAAVLAKKAA